MLGPQTRAGTKGIEHQAEVGLPPPAFVHASVRVPPHSQYLVQM